MRYIPSPSPFEKAGVKHSKYFQYVKKPTLYQDLLQNYFEQLSAKQLRH